MEATCASHPDPDSLWFAESSDHEARSEAARLCSECPALEACKAWTLAMPEIEGMGFGSMQPPRFVQAGLDEKEIALYRATGEYPEKALCRRGHWSVRRRGQCLTCVRVKSRDRYRRPELSA